MRAIHFPRRRVLGPYPFLNGGRPLAFAHRGGAADGDENTPAAFARAVACGYRYLETDAHASRDGVAVLFHDHDLSRLTGDSVTIASLKWSDLRTIRLNGEPLIPRLDDTLASWPGIRFNIDTKSDAAVQPVLDAVAGAAARDRVLIGSFSDARLARVRAATSPRLATAMGTREVARLWAASRLGFAAGLLGFVPRAPAVQVPLYRGRIKVVDERFVRHAHRLGIDVHVWTVDDAQTISALLDLGVDGIMTDRLDILADVYRARGLWPA
ncbi:glycerophosphodiester phosphodiesterase family protein [Stackebrandtia nassauensis]|uniref:Glycerophosphoryl diester phosphodiesterase n=1 Tax=Stackebrandtia nassauensis (strain DSM 44728 / CIP 108903 / NRRL B-16338 / NBRC 102104 / LLR-40K-21) TaxID=446470 RepID=D3Q9G5_STANL|nr:glycerophosphodiester phosphodiesterase family protein [Stackebrandtia nassauensis]ADD42647.1 glycerophosphoryl diester phosphodiesterase [Stackebrandtia nassauensis DSM 44728]